MQKLKRGFTLIEALVLIAIIGIIGTIVYATVADAAVDAQGNKCGTFFTPNCPKDTEVKDARAVQDKLINAVPIPQLSTSLERVNVAKRAAIFNDESKISYIYLVSYGKVMAFFTVKGKVSSLQSYMVPSEKLIGYDGTPCNWSNASTGNAGCYVVAAPDIDGTYGENSNGIFFFTTDGVYVEWKGEYMVADQPLRLATPPELVRQVK